MVASTYPRMDVQHLVYISPSAVVPFAILLGGLPGRWFRLSSFVAFLLPTVLFGSFAVSPSQREARLDTPVGTVRGRADEVTALAKILAGVRPGETLFVFPYAPIFYFLTRADNPTRYSFLQPGMMGFSDEDKALADLRTRPPEKVIYVDVRAEEYLRVWPSSDPHRLRMHRIEQFLRSNYAVVIPPVDRVYRYQVLRLKNRCC